MHPVLEKYRKIQQQIREVETEYGDNVGRLVDHFHGLAGSYEWNESRKAMKEISDILVINNINPLAVKREINAKTPNYPVAEFENGQIIFKSVCSCSLDELMRVIGELIPESLFDPNNPTTKPTA
jgi:hypothetical protein